MAKRPGVSATFHIIAVKDQHCLLYIKHNAIATLYFCHTNIYVSTHFFYYKGCLIKIQAIIQLFIEMEMFIIKTSNKCTMLIKRLNESFQIAT